MKLCALKREDGLWYNPKKHEGIWHSRLEDAKFYPCGKGVRALAKRLSSSTRVIIVPFELTQYNRNEYAL